MHVDTTLQKSQPAEGHLWITLFTSPSNTSPSYRQHLLLSWPASDLHRGHYGGLAPRGRVGPDWLPSTPRVCVSFNKWVSTESEHWLQTPDSSSTFLQPTHTRFPLYSRRVLHILYTMAVCSCFCPSVWGIFISKLISLTLIANIFSRCGLRGKQYTLQL